MRGGRFEFVEKDIMEAAGLETEVLTAEVFGDTPARTEVGRSEWGVDEGVCVFDRVVGRMKGRDGLVGERRERAWVSLGRNGGEVVCWYRPTTVKEGYDGGFLGLHELHDVKCEGAICSGVASYCFQKA